MGSEYDENLSENYFFKQLQEHVDLLKKASENQWILCVPRSGFFSEKKLTKLDIIEHILVRNRVDSPPHYHTLNQREVNVHNKFLIVKTDTITNSIRILFDEIFYVGSYKYTVWCIDAPLNQKYLSNISDIIEIHDLRDCIEFLWVDNVGCVILEKINEAVELFLAEQVLDRLDLQEQKDLIKNLYEQCLEVTLANIGLQSKTNDMNFFNNLQIAVEMYMQTCLGKKLFNSLCTYTAFTDANFNKIIRNVQEIPLKAFDIDGNYYEYLPFAKNELNKINRSCTIVEKLKCLKETLNVLSHQHGVETHALNADGLIEILIFLIIKSSVHNWITNLVFVREFRFSIKSVCDENNFLITTLQAAIECIKSSQLSVKLVDFDCEFIPSSNLKLLFHDISEGNLEKVTLALLTNHNNNTTLKLCHPLCSCDKCESTLLKNNLCEVNSCDERGHTPLHIASKSGHLSVIDFLIEKGADMNRSDCSGFTPLHFAISKGHQQATLLLLHSGANPDLPDYEGNSALHIAVRNGHDNCVKVLIYSLIGRNKLNINCANNTGETPLHFASKFGYTNLVKLLIQHGARIKRNKQNLTPNDVAHNDLIIALLAYAIIEENDIQVPERRVSLNSENIIEHKAPTVAKKKWTTLSLGGHHDCDGRRNFVNFGVRPKNLEQFKKVDLLMKAIENNDLPLTCFYLGIPSPNIIYDSHPSCHPLCTCEKCIENLTEPPDAIAPKQVDNLNINICNSDGFTSVHVAAKYGRLDILRLLLDVGALITLKTYKTFYTPLHLACIHQRIQIVRELLKCGGCNLDVPDSEGNTPLHYACFRNDLRIFDLLLSQGADVNVKNNFGKTVLNEAEERMFLGIVKVLKEQDVKRHSDLDLKEFDAL